MRRLYLLGEIDQLVRRARQRALLRNYDGSEDMELMRHCSHLLSITPRESAAIIYTRDAGHNMGGWWKNPDYERCLHLSISFLENPTDAPLAYNRKIAMRIARAFFGDDTPKAWVEPPVSPRGIIRGVHHYRLFCDAGWRPLMPRGEVYTKDNTPAGWKSFSEIHGWSPTKENALWLKG
jgi:hypothetical protein